jgi:hypothetical protein
VTVKNLQAAKEKREAPSRGVWKSPFSSHQSRLRLIASYTYYYY